MSKCDPDQTGPVLSIARGDIPYQGLLFLKAILDTLHAQKNKLFESFIMEPLCYYCYYSKYSEEAAGLSWSGKKTLEQGSR